MSTIAIPFQPWCVDYHKTMAAMFTAGNAIGRGSSILSVAKDFWILARDFRTLVSGLDTIEHTPPDELGAFVRRLEDLNNSTNKILDLSRKRGLINRTLINASIQSVRSSNESILDIIERFKLSLDPAVASATRDALAEYERGETVSIDSLV